MPAKKHKPEEIIGKLREVEIMLGHFKRILKLDRLRLRGPNGAKDKFLLAATATAQNLRKMAKIIPIPVQMAPA